MKWPTVVPEAKHRSSLFKTHPKFQFNLENEKRKKHIMSKTYVLISWKPMSSQEDP